MKRSTKILALALNVSLAISASAQVQTWDPDGATPGASVSGNWDTTTSNWTLSADSGSNMPWFQGNVATFILAANIDVTLTQPITFSGISLSGAAGTLSISGSAVNNLTLASSVVLDTGSRALTISAPLTGSLDISKIGSGTLTLSGANTYSGGASLGGGITALGADTVSSGGVLSSGPFGTGPVSVNTASTLTTSGGARILENPITLNANLTITGSSPLTFRNSTITVNGGNRTMTVNNTADTTLASNLADDGAARTFTKAGTGKLILTGDNTAYVGPVTVSAGTLVAGSATAIHANGVLTATGTLDLNGYDGFAVGLAGAGSVLLGTNTLTIANAGSSRNFTGIASGTGGLIISNGVSQQIEGNNTFSGGILIQMGTLFLRTNANTTGGISQAAGTGTITIEDNGALPRAAIGANYTTGTVRITNAIYLASGRGLFFPSNGGTNEFAGPVSGPGGFLRDNNGSGLVVLSGGNSYSGGLQIESRTLALANKNALGTGAFNIGNPATFPSSTIVIAPIVELSGATAITNSVAANQNFTLTGTNKLEFSGPLTIPNNITMTLLGPADVKFSGPIDGANPITKAGTGTLILANANTYTGDTAVNAGTLLVNNSSGSGTSMGTVLVATEAALGGNGAISGPVSINYGGTISAGTNSAGRLTLRGGLDLSVGGTNVWELAAEKDSGTGAPGVDYDQIALSGGSLILGGGSILRLSFTGSAGFPNASNPFWQASHTWKIISLGGTAANPGNSNFVGIDGTNGVTSGIFSTSTDGTGSIILSYVSTTVPAPIIERAIASAGTTNALIQWSSISGTTYEIQYKADLNDALWTTLGTVMATNSTASWRDTSNPPPSKRFYRILVR